MIATRAVVLVALLGAGDVARADAVADVIERAKLDVDVQPGAHAFNQLTIDNPLGDIAVEGWDRPTIRIESSKQAPDVESLDRLRISLVPNPDGTVRLTTTADRDPESRRVTRGAVRIDLKIYAPRKARVEATVSAGKLVVSNMDNGGELEAGSGSIRVTNVQGELVTHSLSGPTSIASVFGSVDSQTLSSSLDLDSISGDRLVASAGHGRIAGRRVRSREIQLTTIDGHISLEAETLLRGRVVVASLSGDVDVKLRRGANLALVIRAQGMKVRFGSDAQRPAPDGWVEARIGQVAHNSIPAFVEMRSPRGIVQLTTVDAGK